MLQILAYIDPGSGSLFIQAIIGGVLAASYAIKLYWQKIKATVQSLVARLKNSPKQ